MSNFKKLYDEKIVPELMKEHNYTTIMAVPKLEKIVINMGVGEGSKDEKYITAAVKDLEAISGQKCVVTKARKSIAGFKLREGQPVGVKVTLRGENMYNFFEKLVKIGLPRVRDFRGLSPKSKNKTQVNFAFSFIQVCLLKNSCISYNSHKKTNLWQLSYYGKILNIWKLIFFHNK